MGIVYQARQLQPIRRDVALKVIKPGMDSKEVIARFESERQSLAVMDHPNIAHVFDAGATSAGLPYFVMELADGAPITRYCDSRSLSITERIEIFVPVCNAIQHAHQKGIIHRDIKPSNILVQKRETVPIPKVIDFGLAKALGQEMSDATMLTNLNTVVGTFSYMSPEQADLGRRDIDTRSDVYSLGVVLYELLTGATPLELTENRSYVELLRRIREEEPTRPSTRAPKSVDRELDWITMKALEKDRSRRYETVNGLARDLQRYLDGEPVEAAPPSTTYRVGKFVRKHRWGLATAAAFTVMLVAGVVVSAWQTLRATRAQEEARAVNDFLQNDLLAQASANNQARADNKPDPNLTVRAALDRAAEKIGGRFNQQPLIEALTRHTIGRAYLDLGLYPEAEQQLKRALELRQSTLGNRHPDTWSSETSLAFVYLQEGKNREAESLSQKFLADRRAWSGHDSEALDTMHFLAQAYSNLGKYDQAESLFTKGLEISLRVRGEEHAGTLDFMNDLALLYHREGKYGQAEPLDVKTLDIRRRLLGEEHPYTLVSMNNLASLYRREGKLTQAETLYTKAVEIEQRVLGEKHQFTLLSMAGLADSYRLEGKYPESEQLGIRVLGIANRVLGPEHPTTLTMEHNLAELYHDQRRYALAEALFTKVLDARRRVLGEQHPDTVTTSNELAKNYQDWHKDDNQAKSRQNLGQVNSKP
jgi:non-specific serine/threonine protein kinase/serine/threonine-protein kinase